MLNLTPYTGISSCFRLSVCSSSLGLSVCVIWYLANPTTISVSCWERIGSFCYSTKGIRAGQLVSSTAAQASPAEISRLPLNSQILEKQYRILLSLRILEQFVLKKHTQPPQNNNNKKLTNTKAFYTTLCSVVNITLVRDYNKLKCIMYELCSHNFYILLSCNL